MVWEGGKSRFRAFFWAPVSEPGFLDFQMFDSRAFSYMLVRYRGINNKGVLERPGDKMEGFECNFFYFELSVYRKMLKSGPFDAM